ncbi:MAG: NAD(P)-dependent oxidoreductase [Chitinophagaceae bacterium]|nr:NAD(P)-dependent oxidoreductase [Chitinophagaceae bacterium]
MIVLITGANGFIGSHIANHFLLAGHTVVATSKQFHESTRTLLKDAKLVELDVLNTDQLQNLTLQADVLIHVATANDVISKSNIKGIELSAIGTKNMLDFAVKTKFPNALFFQLYRFMVQN